MGYRGKVEQRQRARELRAESWTLQEIATELGVSKGSVSVWVRDVDFDPRPRNRGHPAGPKHPMRLKREAEIEASRADAADWVGALTPLDRAMYALGLYAGEGGKSDEGGVVFANSDPVLVIAFLSWLRQEFDIDEARLRGRLYLHADLDIDAAETFWSEVTGIPRTQFQRAYRAVVDETLRHHRHVTGCFTVRYYSRSLHRRVMARIAAIGSAVADPG